MPARRSSKGTKLKDSRRWLRASFGIDKETGTGREVDILPARALGQFVNIEPQPASAAK